MAWTYILQCSDGSYYVGSTIDLAQRLLQHNAGEVAAYTRRRRPVTLVWAAESESIRDAYATERRIHGWSRAKKRALIEGDFEALKLLSSRSPAGRAARAAAQEADTTPPPAPS